MPVYKYKGITDKGLVVSNTIEAESKQKVILQLKEKTEVQLRDLYLIDLMKLFLHFQIH